MSRKAKGEISEIDTYSYGALLVRSRSIAHIKKGVQVLRDLVNDMKLEKAVACTALYFLAHGLFKLKFYKDALLEIQRLLSLEENYPNGKIFKELCLERIPKSEGKALKKMLAKKNYRTKPISIMTEEEAKVHAEKDRLRRLEIAAKYATRGPELDEEEMEKEAKKQELLRIRKIRTLRNLGQESPSTRGFGGFGQANGVGVISISPSNISADPKQPKRPCRPAPTSLVEKVQKDMEKKPEPVNDVKAKPKAEKEKEKKKKDKDNDKEKEKGNDKVKDKDTDKVKDKVKDKEKSKKLKEHTSVKSDDTPAEISKSQPPQRPQKPSGTIMRTISVKNESEKENPEKETISPSKPTKEDAITPAKAPEQNKPDQVSTQPVKPQKQFEKDNEVKPQIAVSNKPVLKKPSFNTSNEVTCNIQQDTKQIEPQKSAPTQGIESKKNQIAMLFAKGPPPFMMGGPPPSMGSDDLDDLDDERIGATNEEHKDILIDESGLPSAGNDYVLQCATRAKGPKRRPPRRV